VRAAAKLVSARLEELLILLILSSISWFQLGIMIILGSPAFAHCHIQSNTVREHDIPLSPLHIDDIDIASRFATWGLGFRSRNSSATFGGQNHPDVAAANRTTTETPDMLSPSM
jgi:hypothetical protein